jgi:hypothetical protein
MMVSGAWLAPVIAYALRLLYACPRELATRRLAWMRHACASRGQAFRRRCGLRYAPTVLRVNRTARYWYQWEKIRRVSAMGGVG